MSSKDNLALDLEHGVRRWDRARWISVFSSHNPTIREVTECLGLGLSASSSTTNRGIPKFDNPDYRKLSSEVTKLSKELPKERDALLDFAADPHSLDKELEDLLGTYGPAIWGKDADRSCLLTPDSTKKTYNKDLFFDDPEHKEILKIHLHRWIIIKACYYIRNMKLKRPSGANEYDTLADIDGDGISPHGTPQSLTPPERGVSLGADLEVKPINLKKRKSHAHMSMSDGEDLDGTPAKRPFSTMPISRKGSPRKSLKSLYPAINGSSENTPPLPNQPHVLSPAPGVVPEPHRVQLSPLSSNELNGVVASRPNGATQSPAPSGFTPVNTAAFAAVNNTPPTRDVSRDPPAPPPRESQQPSPLQKHRHAANYTSPYEPAARNPAPLQPAPASARSPTSAHPPLQATPAHHRPDIAIPPINKESPVAHHVHHAHIAPQPHPQTPNHTSPTVAHHPPAQTQAAMYPQSNLPPHVQAQQLPQRPPSRANTPGHHTARSLAPHPPSRSSTPLAQAAPNQPPMAPNQHIASAPPVQIAPAYGIQLVPTQEPGPPPPPSLHRVSSAHVQPAAAPHHPHPQHQPVLKSQATTEPMQGVQAIPIVTKPVVSLPDIRMLQYEVTAGLFTNFYPRSNAPPDEPTLLRNLQSLWYHGESMFRRELGSHFDVISKILTLWLHERSAIIALRHSMATHPGVSSAGLVDRLLAMNDIRIMRLKWKNMSTVEGSSSEDLLCQAFKVMTNTEGSDHLFKDGLDRLNGGVFEFLRNEDAKIVMHRR